MSTVEAPTMPRALDQRVLKVIRAAQNAGMQAIFKYEFGVDLRVLDAIENAWQLPLHSKQKKALYMRGAPNGLEDLPLPKVKRFNKTPCNYCSNASCKTENSPQCAKLGKSKIQQYYTLTWRKRPRALLS